MNIRDENNDQQSDHDQGATAQEHTSTGSANSGSFFNGTAETGAKLTENSGGKDDSNASDVEKDQSGVSIQDTITEQQTEAESTNLRTNETNALITNTDSSREDSGERDRPETAMIGGGSNISNAVANISNTVGFLGETIASAINKLSETAVQISKSVLSDTGTNIPVDAGEEDDDGDVDKADSDQLMSATTCQLFKDEATETLSGQNVGDKETPLASPMSVTESMQHVKAVKDLRNLIIALTSSPSVRDSVLALATTIEVRSGILALASDGAAGDGIVTGDVGEAYQKSAAKLSPTESIQESSEIIQSVAIGDNADARKGERLSNIITVDDIVASDSYITVPKQPRVQSWVGADLDTCEPQKVSVCSVEELLPDENSSSDTSSLPKQSDQTLDDFDQLVQDNVRRATKETFDPLKMSGREKAKRKDTAVIIDSQASAFLATVQPSSTPLPEQSEEMAAVELPSSMMVFGAAGKTPSGVEDGNSYNLMRRTSQNDDEHREDGKPRIKVKRKTSAPRTKSSDDTEDDSESLESEESAEAKDPCGVCSCCKGMQKRLVYCEDDSSGGHQDSPRETGDSTDDSQAVSFSLTALDCSSLRCENNILLADEDLRKHDPKEWLRRTTKAFMFRDGVRQMVLRHKLMQGDCTRTKVTRISCVPSSPSHQSKAGKTGPKLCATRVQLEISNGECTVDYKMRVPRTKSERVPDPNRRSKSRVCDRLKRDSKNSQSPSCDRRRKQLLDESETFQSCSKDVIIDFSARRSSSPGKSCKSKSRNRGNSRESTEQMRKKYFLRKAKSTLSCMKQYNSSWLSDDVDVPSSGCWNSKRVNSAIPRR